MKIGEFYHKIFFLVIVLILSNCNENQAIDNETLISEDEAERRLTYFIAIKAAEQFPNESEFILPYIFPADLNCDRRPYYRKDSVNECGKIIITVNIPGRTFSDFSENVRALIREVCNIERQIFLDNSTVGEINFCSVKF